MTMKQRSLAILALPVALLALGTPSAVAAPRGVVPATGAGIVTIFHSRGFHLSAESNPSNITAGPDGALWFTNPGNNTIGRITTWGSVNDYASPDIDHPWAITAGPDGAVWFTNFFGPSIGRITISGTVTNFTGAVNGPVSIATSPFDTLWYSNWSLFPKTHCSWSIGRITTTGTTSCFKAKGIVYPQDITPGPDSAMWFTNGGLQDGSRYAIGRITKTGRVTIYPLTDYPNGIVVGSDHALWFTYTNNNAIGRITTSGVLTKFTDPSISDPAKITAGPDGALWFVNGGTHTIGRITTHGDISSYPAGSAAPDTSSSMATGPDGAIWFTNPATETIGRITTDITPAIFAKSPSSGPPGTKVIITGRNLAHASRVDFNGAPATIVSDSRTYVVAIVPPGATSGRITITTPAGTVAKNGGFTVTQ
jgi:virginiamycin B lyase